LVDLPKRRLLFLLALGAAGLTAKLFGCRRRVSAPRTINIGAWNGARLVGSGRVLTDE
jgi:hypothetical protein